MSKVVMQNQPPKLLVLAAFAAVYIIWGSTYLGIRIGIQTIPPFFLIGTRFLIAGAILYFWCIGKGEKPPSLKLFANLGVGGVLMLFLGNGSVSWAEQYLPSGLVAIIVATVPLWFVILDKSQWKYYFSNRIIIIGFVTGFAGVLLLFAGKGSTDFLSNRMKLVSFFVLLTGSVGWTIGSLYSKYKKAESSVTMKAAVQMLAAGAVSIVAGFVINEQSKMKLSAISVSSLLALLYLIIMGSLVAFMSYIWLLSVRRASVVGTYAYVNPVVAVFLGWLIAGEQITSQQIIALVVILAGVILVSFAPASGKISFIKKQEILQKSADCV